MSPTVASGPRQALPRIAARPVRPPRSPRVAGIADAARAILDAEGSGALTMRRLADDLGIKAPSLYKHLPSREALVLLLVDDALFEAGDVAHAAVDRPGKRGPVAALLAAYRSFGLEHPNLYRLTTGPDLPRESLTPGLEDWAGEPYYRATGEPHLAQALWAYAHGMVMLEIDQRFLPSNLDLTWRAGADAFGIASEAAG
jgi:AcrR family transcriptional regulator